MTRGYSQNTAGAFFAATTLFLLVGQAAEVGADEAMLRYIPMFRASGRIGETRALVKFILKPVVIVSVLAALVGLVLSSALGQVLKSGDVSAPTMALAIRVLLPFIPLIALGETLLAATRGFQKMGPSTLIYDIGLAGLQALSAFVALQWFEGSVVSLVIAWVFPYAAVVVAAAASLRAIASKMIEVEQSPRQPLVEKYWSFVGPRAIARFAQYGLRRVDVLLVASLAGVRDAAIYTALTRLITLGTIGVQAVQQVAQPKLGELFELQDNRRASIVFRTSTVWLIAASWPVYLLLAVFAPVLLSVFGVDYVHGSAALAVLCVSQLVTVATGPVDVVLVQMGRSSQSLFNQTVALSLNVVLCVVLIPAYGIMGAAIARVVALQWNNLAPAFQVYRTTGLQPLDSAFRVVALAALGCFGCIGLAARIVIGPELNAIAAALTVGGIGYIALLNRFRRLTRVDVLLETIRLGRRAPLAVVTPNIDDLLPGAEYSNLI